MLHDQRFAPLAVMLLAASMGILDGTHGIGALANSAPRGVNPKDAQYYIPNGEGKWKCFSGAPTLSAEQINDDYCDCADGSDEPGTSACTNGRFFCANVGHLPEYIPSWKVDDGICEPGCCDGSDEASGVCPNRCVEQGQVYREQKEAEERVLSVGRATRDGYVTYGMEARTRWVMELAKASTEQEELAGKIKELGELTRVLEEAETAERRSGLTERLRMRLRKCGEDRKRLEEANAGQKEEIRGLVQILQDLARDYNKNYHDMAVKAAVTGYEEYLKGQEEARDEQVEREGEEDQDENVAPEEDILEHIPDEDLYGGEADPDTEEAKKGVVGALKNLWGESLLALGLRSDPKDIIRSARGEEYSGSAEVRKAMSEAQSRENVLREETQRLKEKMERDFGREEEYAELDQECISKDTGEYTYEVCLFGSASQRSNKDGQSTNLGRFASWNPEAANKGDPAFYTRQVYNQGTQCWNGPERSVQLQLECGKVNEILTVTEPEKCEYHVRMRTPAACVAVPVGSAAGHDEL